MYKLRKTQIQKGGVGRRFFSFLPDARGFAAATGRGMRRNSDVRTGTTNNKQCHQPHMMKKQLTNKEIEEIAYLRTCSLLLLNNNNYNLNRGSSHLTTSNNQLTNNHNVNIKMEKEEEDGNDAGF